MLRLGVAQQVAKEKRALQIQVRKHAIRFMCDFTDLPKNRPHEQDVERVIRSSSRDLADSMGLAISVRGGGPRDFHIGKGSDEAWARLKNMLRTQIITRLRSNLSFCQPVNGYISCAFCRVHRQALTAAAAS